MRFLPAPILEFERKTAWLQARHRAPKLERYLRGLDNSTRAALLRELQGTLRDLYSDVLRAFGV